jgi:hypothetical protein
MASAVLANTSWLTVTFDTDGELSFAGTRPLTDLVFRLVPDVNRASSDFASRITLVSWRWMRSHAG